MHDLENLELQITQYALQRTQHQEMFHKLSGAIEVIQEMVNSLKKESLEKKNESTESTTDSEHPKPTVYHDDIIEPE